MRGSEHNSRLRPHICYDMFSTFVTRFADNAVQTLRSCLCVILASLVYYARLMWLWYIAILLDSSAVQCSACRSILSAPLFPLSHTATPFRSILWHSMKTLLQQPISQPMPTDSYRCSVGVYTCAHILARIHMAIAFCSSNWQQSRVSHAFTLHGFCAITR